MTASSYNPHITISSPFGVADLPTLFCWRNRIHKLVGEPEEDLFQFMEEQLAREGLRTFAAYRDGELGGYFEASPGDLHFLSDDSTAAVAKIEMIFKGDFFKQRPENGNGANPKGQQLTQPALNLVLRELVEEYELFFFPLSKQNRPIQSLVASVGAVRVGIVESTRSDMSLFVLSRPEWEITNAAFLAAYELEHPDTFSMVEGSEKESMAEQAE